MRDRERFRPDMADTWRRFNGIELERQEPRSSLLPFIKVKGRG
jgi:hypothetical protein